MKRIISFLLCLSMLLSMVPMNVFASAVEETTAPTETFPVEESTAAVAETEETAETTETAVETTEAAAETTEAAEEATEAAVETTAQTTAPEETVETEPAVVEEIPTAQLLTWVPEEELPGNEELFAGYVERAFYGSSISTFGTAAWDRIEDPSVQVIYAALKPEIMKIASGERDSAVIAVGQNRGEAEVTVPISQDESITVLCPFTPAEETDMTGVTLTQEGLYILLDALLADLPYDLYWFDKTMGVGVLGDEYGNLAFYFTVAGEYRKYEDSGEYYNAADYVLDKDLTGAAAAAAENAQKIKTEAQDYSDYGKLATYADYIMDQTSYNYDAVNEDWDYGNPWQLIWVFDGDSGTNVVCEGYSKAFQYLCDLSEFDNDILCYSVVGYLNPSKPGYGAHMWNIVTVNDSPYLVDVTNCDSGFDLFLRGGTIAKGVQYFDYSKMQYVEDTSIYGTYTFDGCKFVYDLDTIEQWGTEITTLATTDLTEATFPTGPEKTTMTGEELETLLAGTAAEITVDKALTITNSVSVPAGKTVTVENPGSVTVANGGSLSVEGRMIFPATSLTVQSGGSLTLAGEGYLGFYGSSALTVETGAVYSIEDTAEIYANMGTVLTGITKGEVVNSNMILDAATGLEKQLADFGAADYKTFYLDIATNYTVSDKTALPENVAVSSYGNTFTVADGGVLTLNGSWTLGYDATADGGSPVGGHIVVESGGKLVLNGPVELLYGSTLTVESGAELVNASTVSVDAASSLTNNGTIVNSGTINGTVGGSGSVTVPAITGEEFVELLERQSGTYYMLFQPVEITSDITLPEIDVWVWGNGSITVKDGGSLTVVNTVDVANGGTVTVEEGSALTVVGILCAAGGGTVNIQGEYTLGERSRVVVNYPGVINGIETSYVHLYAPVWDEASLLDAISLQGYASSELIVSGSDLDQDGTPDPIILTKDLTVPEDWSFVIGDEMGVAAVLEIAENVTLTNNSHISIWLGASLILRNGAVINGTGSIGSDGTVSNYGRIDIPVSGTVTNYMTQKRFDELLSGVDELTIEHVLTLTEDMTIPAGKYVTFANGGSLTVAKGAELTVEGNITFEDTAMTVESGGSLTLTGSGYLGFLGGALTIEEGAAYSVADTASIYATIGTVLTGIGKDQVCNSNMIMDPDTNLQDFAEFEGGGYKKFYLSIATDYVVSENMTIPANILLDHYANTVTVTNGATLTVNGDWNVGIFVNEAGGIQVPGHIVIENGALVTNGSLNLMHGSTLTVKESGSYTANGSFTNGEGCTVDNAGTVELYGSYSLQGSWGGNAFTGVPTTQSALQAQLNTASDKVYLTNGLTLNKDLTVPAGAQLVISGSIVIPAERTLVIDGSVLIAPGGSITAENGGAVINNGSLRIEGTLDMTEGVYSHGDAAEVILARLSLSDKSNTDYKLSDTENGDIFRVSTVLMEGWHIGQLSHLLENLDPDDRPKALQINICGELTLEDVYPLDPYGPEWVLPEYATLFVGDLGYGEAVLTVSKGHSLISNGAIEIGNGGTLVIESGAKLVGRLPVCQEGGSYVNQSVTVLTGKLEESMALNGPAMIEGTLEIPEGVELLISGEDAELSLTGGAQLINGGSIVVELDGTLDASVGSYESIVGTLTQKFHCDAEGNVTRATVLGIDAAAMKYSASTESDDAVIREQIESVSALVESGEIADPFALSNFFCLDFMGETVLSGDLEIPFWTVPYVSGTLTVPEGVVLVDHCGMVISGTLNVEGKAVATGDPIYVESGAVLVLADPDSCVNYLYEGLALEGIEIKCTATTALVGQDNAIAVWIDSVTPVGAQYYGDYSVHVSGNAGWFWTEDDVLMVYDNTAETVTMTITAMDRSGNPLEYNDEPISQEVTLNFVRDSVVLAIQEEAGDFYEGGFLGLYPGSTLNFYGYLSGSPGMADSSLSWECALLSEDTQNTEVPETVATIRESEEGILTVTASETLTEGEVIEITAKTADGSASAFTTLLILRPKANTVDVAMDGVAVTGQTVSFDLNREGDTVALAPVTSPADACNLYGTDAEGKALVQWKSSNESIAEVDDFGNVTFKKTGKVKITMTANFGSKKTAVVTFNVVALAQEIVSGENNATALIGGSSATYTVYDAEDSAKKALKSSAVKWFLCDRNGQPIDSHPYASVTAAGKLSTKAVQDEIDVYLMAQVVGNEDIGRLSEPVKVELYPAVVSTEILDEVGKVINGKTLLFSGDDYQLDWNAGPYIESVKDVGWKSSAPKVATVSSEGLIEVLKPGTAKFTLTLTALNGKKTTAAVTMKFGEFVDTMTLTAMLPGETEVTEDLDGLTLRSGETIRFYAETAPVQPGVQWSVDNTKLASISSTGILKAKTVNNPETVTVVAISKDGAKGESVSVNILPKQVTTDDGSKADALVIYLDEDNSYELVTKATRTLTKESQLQLYAIDAFDYVDAYSYDDLVPETVEWTSANPKVAAVDAETGLVTAVGTGSVKITATDGYGRTAYVTLKISKISEDVTITQKKTGSRKLTVASGKSLDLVGTVEYNDGSTDTKVNWEVSDPALATVSTSGKLTAAKNLTKPVTVTVWAYAKDGVPESFDSLDIAILPLTTGVEIFGSFGGAYPKDVSNTTRKWDLTTEGDSFSLSVKTFPEGAMKNVSWKSSSPKIATVDEDGNVTCLKAGTATITATALDGSGKKATFKVTVHRTTRQEMLTLPAALEIRGGNRITFTKEEGYSVDTEATNKKLTWSLTYENGASVPKTVASISSSGVLTTKKVSAETVVRVTASATDGSGCFASSLVTLFPLTSSVTIVNAPSEMHAMSTMTLKAVSEPAIAGDQFSWKSSNTAVATVSSAGVITTKKAGTVTITATAKDGSGKKGTATITVLPQATVQLNETLYMTETYELFAGGSWVRWSTTNDGILYVHETGGLIQANHTGTATITATAADGATASMTIRVEPVTFSVAVNIDGTGYSTETFTSSYPYLVDALEAEGFMTGEYSTYSDGTAIHTSYRIVSVDGYSSGAWGYRFQWWCLIGGEEYCDLYGVKIVPGGYYRFEPYQD